jgi:feruloyl esterase
MYFDDLKYDVVNDLNFNDKKTLALLTERHPVWGVTTPDLSAFQKAGGKLIMWAPMSENAVPPATEIEYMAAIRKRLPGADDFVRLYEVPGVHHCAGGPGPQDSPDRLLDAVIGWVEEGRRPGPLVMTGPATRPAMPALPGVPSALAAPPIARTVLVCPNPQKAVFAGKPGGYPYDAANWKCQ